CRLYCYPIFLTPHHRSTPPQPLPSSSATSSAGRCTAIFSTGSDISRAHRRRPCCSQPSSDPSRCPHQPSAIPLPRPLLHPRTAPFFTPFSYRRPTLLPPLLSAASWALLMLMPQPPLSPATTALVGLPLPSPSSNLLCFLWLNLPFLLSYRSSRTLPLSSPSAAPSSGHLCSSLPFAATATSSSTLPSLPPPKDCCRSRSRIAHRPRPLPPPVGRRCPHHGHPLLLPPHHQPALIFFPY
ncbi:hypothetical protein B296_00049045, partial [Ensete ventricosum]